MIPFCVFSIYVCSEGRSNDETESTKETSRLVHHIVVVVGVAYVVQSELDFMRKYAWCKMSLNTAAEEAIKGNESDDCTI